MVQRIKTTLFQNLLILNIMFFVLYILVLQHFAKGWNPFDKSISQMVFYLPSPLFMSFGFGIYGLMGIIGTLPILKSLNIGIRTRKGLFFISPFIFYVILAFFPENKGVQIHLGIVWFIVASWTIARVFYAKTLKDKNFINATRIIIVLEVIFALITTAIWGPHTFTEAVPFVTGAFWYLLLVRKLNHNQTVPKTNLPPLLPV